MRVQIYGMKSSFEFHQNSVTHHAWRVSYLYWSRRLCRSGGVLGTVLTSGDIAEEEWLGVRFPYVGHFNAVSVNRGR